MLAGDLLQVLSQHPDLGTVLLVVGDVPSQQKSQRV